MTDLQENKRSMYLAVQKVCNANNAIWSGLPAFVDAFGRFENLISDIDAQRQIQEGKITGITENKQKEEDEMIQATLEMAATVHAYASIIGDHSLRNKVGYSPSTLQKLRDTELKDVCQAIHDAAASVIDNLADYGKTPDDLTQLQTEINDFTEMIARPRTAIATRATATAQLVELFNQTDKLLKNQLDKLMLTYQLSEPAFWNMYHSARKIVSMGTRTKTEETLPEV